MVVPRLVAPMLASLAMHACAPVCDEPGLRRAAEALAAGPERRSEGLDALRDACPTLPPALAQGLRDGESSAEAARDPAWWTLLARTCPAATPAKGAPAARDLDETRRLCDFDRHGLLAPDAVFVREDLFVFALLEWLIDGRVERPLAAAVASPLLTAREFAAWGLTPPRGRIDVAPRRVDGPTIRLTPTALSVDDTIIHPLSGGRPAPGTFVDHVSPALRAALDARSLRAREQAEREARPWDATATLLADRTTPLATLVDVLYNASQAELHTFQLLVHDGQELRSQQLLTPLAWRGDPDQHARRERPLNLTFIVRPDAVTLIAGEINERSFSQPAGAAIADHASKLKQLFPREFSATHRVAGEVPLQAVVSLMDTVTGERCKLRGLSRDEPIPEECLFWQHALELEPPIVRPLPPPSWPDE